MEGTPSRHRENARHRRTLLPEVEDTARKRLAGSGKLAPRIAWLDLVEASHEASDFDLLWH